MSALTYLRNKIRYIPLPRIFIDGLNRLGIQIRLISLVRERTTGSTSQQYRDSLKGYEVGFLEAKDM